VKQAKLHAEIGSALATSILKLRAFEMVLMLFYIEDLKTTVVGSIRATPTKRAALPQGGKDLYKTAWKILVDDRIITDAERAGVEQLIDYRNVIAHQLCQLTGDVGEYAEFAKSKYQSGALTRLMQYRKKIIDGIRGRYVFELCARGLLFEPAEKAYKQELTRLRKRSSKQFASKHSGKHVVRREPLGRRWPRRDFT